MIYCDTSLLIAALMPEIATARVQQWLGKWQAGTICVSAWTITEFSSALAIRMRQGVLSLEQRVQVLTNWRAMLAEQLLSLPVPAQAFDLATGYCDRHELGVRGGDALHIAIASLGRHRLATLDRTMAAAAVVLGVGLEEIPAS